MERGTVFLSDTFPLKDRAVLRVILSRLVKEGLITRLGPGLYLYPRYSPVLGTYATPSLNDIAMAIVANDKANIAYSGVHAMNKLGLSTQVPTNAVFLTDGSARTIKLEDGRTLVFKRVAAKNFAYTSAIMQMIVFALREIGKEDLSEEKIARIQRILLTVPADDFHTDVRLAPEWVQKILRSLREE
jgi:predicted transcriptional regulator of viral defense system